MSDDVKFKQCVTDFFSDDSAATMVEYGIMVALIAIAVATVVFILGAKIDALFKAISECILQGTSAACNFTG